MLFVILRLPSLFEGFWYGDEGFYASQAEAILRGKVLYLEAWDHKPPLMVWTYSLGGIFGWDIGYPLVKVFSIVSGIISIVLLSKIFEREKVSKRIQNSLLIIYAVLLGSPILEGNVANSEVFFITINLAILYISLYLQKPVFIGLLLSFSFLIKPQSFAEASSIILALLIFQLWHGKLKRNYSYYNKLILTFLSLILAYFVYLSIQGSFIAFLDAAFITNFLYVGGEDSFISSWNVGKIIVTLCLFSLCLYAQKSKKLNKTEFIIAVGLLASLFLVTLSGRLYLHYWIQILPVLFLGLGLLFNSKYLNVLVKTTIALAFFIVAVFSFNRGISLPSVSTTSVVPFVRYYVDFSRYILLKDENTISYFWKNHDSNKLRKEFARYFNENYPGIDYYYYGEETWIFTQLDANFTNKYLVWYHLTFTDDKLEEAIELRNKAEILIIDENSPGKLAKFLSDVEDEFIQIDQYNNYLIYANRDE